MSNPTQFTPSLETCKRLSEADVVIESYFSWVWFSKDISIPAWVEADVKLEKNERIYKAIPAPTSAEILALMPLPSHFDIIDSEDKFQVYVAPNGVLTKFCKPTLEEALSETLIWLKGQGNLK